MKTASLPALLVVLAASRLIAQSGGPALEDGVISYTDITGRRSRVQVGGPCADLWVSPDAETIAFVRIDRSEPDDLSLEPFVEESTVFIASRSNGFNPVRISFPPPRLDRRTWRVFRHPVASPDAKTVYFLVPSAGTSFSLMSVSTTGGAAKLVADVGGYCVLWGGEYNGDLLTIVRRTGSVEQGFVQWYYLNSASLGSVRVGVRDKDGDFGEFVKTWIRKYGGTCETNLN